MFKKVLAISFLFLFNIALSYAQTGIDPNPCGGVVDPDEQVPCEVPLDTWMFFLVIAAVIFGTYQLYKRQKPISL